VQKCVPLIAGSKFEEANHLIDSVLQNKPNETDAWMMKGNVILNRHLYTKHHSPVITIQDESIFSEDAMGLTQPPQIPNKVVADSVEQFWFKSLSIDSTREDIMMGLCTLYGMSGQAEKLWKLLPILKKVSKKGFELAYLMEDYARLLRERVKTADANKTFATIVSLYPNLSSLKSDWAGELLFNDDLKNATIKAKEALNNQQIDGQTKDNLVDIFLSATLSQLAVQTVEKFQTGTNNYKYAGLYNALNRFAVGDTSWKRKMKEELSNSFFEKDTDQIVLVCKTLSSTENFKKKYDIYMAILSAPINTFISWAVLSRASKEFPDSIQIPLMLGEFYLNGKNYSKANEYFSNAMKVCSDSLVKDDTKMIYAFSLYKAGRKPEATTLFKDIANDKNVFKKQAALYFLFKINNTTKELVQLSKEKKKTKYAYFADILLGINIKQ